MAADCFWVILLVLAFLNGRTLLRAHDLERARVYLWQQRSCGGHERQYGLLTSLIRAEAADVHLAVAAFGAARIEEVDVFYLPCAIVTRYLVVSSTVFAWESSDHLQKSISILALYLDAIVVRARLPGNTLRFS